MQLFTPQVKYGAILIGSLLVLAFTWWNGYSRADDKWTIKWQQREIEISQTVAKELDRQQQANDKAKTLEAARIAALRKREAELEKQIEAMNEEAANDPDANTTGVTAGGVSRLNTIR